MMIVIGKQSFGPDIVMFSVLIIMIAVAGGHAGDINSEQIPSHVGYKIIDLDYPKNGQAQTLTMAVWYPTAEPPSSYHYVGPTTGKVVVNAPPLNINRPWPFLLYSHGFGGGGIAAVFLTEQLAARGWIVAAPDHQD